MMTLEEYFENEKQKELFKKHKKEPVTQIVEFASAGCVYYVIDKVVDALVPAPVKLPAKILTKLGTALISMAVSEHLGSYWGDMTAYGMALLEEAKDRTEDGEKEEDEG